MLTFDVSEGLKDLYKLCGIYFLMKDGEVDYIGRSVNIGNRLMSHHVFDRNYHDEIRVYEVPFVMSWTLKNIELDFIRQYNPPRNINATSKQSEMQLGRKRT